MSRTWAAQTQPIGKHTDPYQSPVPRRPKVPLEQAVLWKARREKAWTVAGWLLVAFLVLVCAAMIPLVVHIWHAGGPLTGGHP